jgi:hypothetical protein
MANEAVCILAPTKFSNVTVADGATIEKGTILKLSADPNTAAASSGSGDVFAGIAWTEKVANDGQTQLGVALDGEWDMTFNSGLGGTLGATVCTSGANLIRVCVAGDLLTGALIGKVLETASAGEVVRVRVGAI